MNSPSATIAVVIFYTLVMLWLGLNAGVLVSMRDGPEQACRSLRVSILNCDWREQQ